MKTVNAYKFKAVALRELRDAGFRMAGILSRSEANPKVSKNGKLGVLSAPLHLAPYNVSGFQVCPQASEGCAAACLHTAGNPAYMSGKDKSRKAKTRAYFLTRDAFIAVLAFEIDALRKKAKRLGMQPAIRLNATSDLPWEKRKILIDGKPVFLMDYFSDVQFYDYTKIHKRMIAYCNGDMPANYHLTFSKSEDNDALCVDVLKRGGNVAVVCDLPTYKQAVASGALPYPYHTLQAVDGDVTDYRPADPDMREDARGGAVVALKAKGDARHDTSGFTLRGVTA